MAEARKISRPTLKTVPSPGEAPRKERPPVVTIGKSRAEIFAFLRLPENYPSFMKDVLSVAELSPRRWRWVGADGPSGTETWDTESSETENSFSLLSVQTEGVPQRGTFTLESLGARGTRVTYELDFTEAVGVVTKTVGKMLGQDLPRQAAADLRRLKAFLETGEVPTTHGQPTGADEETAH